MAPAPGQPRQVDDELDVLSEMVPLAARDIVELGCGAAALARALLGRFPDSRVAAVELDQRQQAKNAAAPAPGLHFVTGMAQAIPFPDASFDLALMLKSLHHVPLAAMARALGEAARVLRPAGLLYVSEPVYDGALNEVVRTYNDEGAVRAAAQSALDDAVRAGVLEQVAERSFDMPVHFADFADFERRMMRPTYADHRIDDARLAAARAVFDPNCGPAGARFARPMHVRLFRRPG